MKSLLKLWQNVSGIGLTPDMPFTFRQRIILSNQMSVLICLMAILFIFIDLFIWQTGFSPVISMILLALSTPFIFLLNYLGLSGISRLIISVAPSIATLAMNITKKLADIEKIGTLDYIPKIGAIHYISPRMVMLSTIVIPLIIFSKGEMIYLILAMAIILGLCTGYENIHDYYHVNHKDLGIEIKAHDIIYEDMILMFVIIFGAMVFFRYLHRQYDQQMAGLLKEAHEKNKKLNERETRLKATLDEIELSREDERRRNWEASGLARFTHLLRSQSEDNKIYPTLLSGIIKYVNVQQ